jgi:hypothetical protein
MATFKPPAARLSPDVVNVPAPISLVTVTAS